MHRMSEAASCITMRTSSSHSRSLFRVLTPDVGVNKSKCVVLSADQQRRTFYQQVFNSKEGNKGTRMLNVVGYIAHVPALLRAGALSGAIRSHKLLQLLACLLHGWQEKLSQVLEVSQSGDHETCRVTCSTYLHAAFSRTIRCWMLHI
jgi:hypothetical protein